MGRNFPHKNRGRGGFRPSQGRGRGDYGRGGFSSHGESRGRGRNEKGFHDNRGRGHSPPRRPANYRDEEHLRGRNVSRDRENLRAERSENRFDEGYRQGRGTSPHRFDRRGASHTQHRGGGDKARGARPVQDELDVQSDLLYGDEGVDIVPTKWGKHSRSPSREMDMFREKSITPSRSPQRPDRAQSQDSSFGSKPVLERLGGFVEEPQRPVFPDQSIRITVGNDICLKQGRGQATSRLGPPVDAVSPERRFRQSESSSPPDKRRRSRSRSNSSEGDKWRHSRSRSYSAQRSQSRGRSGSRSPSYRRSRSRSRSRGRSYHRRRRSRSTDSDRSFDRYDKRRSHTDREHKKRKPERRGSDHRRTYSGSSERHQSENRGSLEKDRSKRESFIRNSRGLVSTKPHVLDLLENIAHGMPMSLSEADKNVEQVNLNKPALASSGVEDDIIQRSIKVKPELQQEYRSPLLETPSPVPSNPPEVKVKSILKNSGRDNSVHNQTNQSIMIQTQNQDLYSNRLPGFNTGEKSGLGHEFLSPYSAKSTEFMKSQSDAFGKAEDSQSHKASGAGFTDNPPPDRSSRPGAPLIPGLGDINVEDEDEFLYGDLDQQPAESESSQPVETHMIPPEEVKEEKPQEAKHTESNPLLENVLKSIGFNFELSQIMQEKAQKDREASAPRKDPPPDPLGINQAASFLGGGGLTHVDFGSVFDPGSVQGKVQPVGQQAQQKGTKRKILESVSAESYEQKAKRYLEEQAKRYISGESEFEHQETHSQHGALANVGRYSARRLPDVDPFSLSPKGNESHMASSDPYQERLLSNAPHNDPYQERTGGSIPHDRPYMARTDFGQDRRDRIPRSDSYEKRYQHVPERHSPFPDEISTGRRSRLSEGSSAGWDRLSSRDSDNERSSETQQFSKRLDSSYRSPSPSHTDYRRYQGSTEHQDRQMRTDDLHGDPNEFTDQKSRQGDHLDKNTTRHIFPICESADGKEYRHFDRDKSKTRQPSREMYKMSPKEMRRQSPREDLYRQSPREETYKLSSREEVYKQSPKDELYKQSHREEVYKQSPREELYKQSPREEVFKQSPREDVFKQSPREELYKHSPREEIQKQSPREDLYKQSSRVMYKQTKQSQKDAYRQSSKEMYKKSPKDLWEEEPAQSATKPSRSFRHPDQVMGERVAQKKKFSKNERPSDRDRFDDISYRDKEWHGRQSWERSPEREEQQQEVKEKITRPLVKIEFRGTTQPPQKKTKRLGEHLEEEHNIREHRIVKNLTSERSRQREISETGASRSPRDSLPGVKMKPIGSPSNTSRGFSDSPQVKGDLQVKELYMQSSSSNQESRRTVVPPSGESKKSEPKETRSVSITMRKPLNLPKPSTFYDSDTEDLLGEVEKARLLHESKERQTRLVALEKELAILKRQQNELMRKRQRQKYGHRDPVLMQNNKLQEKVASQISKLRKEAEGKERELLKKLSVPAKKQVSPKATSDDKSPIHKIKEMKKGPFDKVSKDKPPKEEKKAQPLQVDPKGSDPKPEDKKDNKAVSGVEKTEDKKAEKKSKKIEIQYQCYDQGNHWCPSCNVLSSTLYNLFEHLHGKKHVQNMDQYDRPWMPDSLKQSKKSAETKGMKALVCPYKGTEFMMPVKGFYCKLCKEFSGDETCGVEHLKSKTHNENYTKYIEDNLFYEERLNLDRAAGMAVRRSEEEKEKAEAKEEKAAAKKKLQTEKTEKARQRNLELIKKEQVESENVEDLGDCTIPEPVTLGTASHPSHIQVQDKQGDGTREVSKLSRKSISIKLSGPSKVTIGKNALQIGNKGKKDIRPVSKPVEIMPMKRFRKPKPLGAEKIDEIKAEEDPMETGSVDSFFTIGKGNDSVALPFVQDAIKNEANQQKISEKGAKDPENFASFSSVTDPIVHTKIDDLSSEPPAPGTSEDNMSSGDKIETTEKGAVEVQSLNQIDLSQVPLPPGPCLAASNSKPTTNMATTSAGNLYSVFFSNSMKESASEPILPKSTIDTLKVSVAEVPLPGTGDIAPQTVMEIRASDDKDQMETGNKVALENISVPDSKVVQQQDVNVTGAETSQFSESKSCQNKNSTSDPEISMQEKCADVQQIQIGNIKGEQSAGLLNECVEIPLPEPILPSASIEGHANQNKKIMKPELTGDSCIQSTDCADKDITLGHQEKTESSETVCSNELRDSHYSNSPAVVTAGELQTQQLHSGVTPSVAAETLALDSSTNISESCTLTTQVSAQEDDLEDGSKIEEQTFTSSNLSQDTNGKEPSVSNECSLGNNTMVPPPPQHLVSAVESSQQTASPPEGASAPDETSAKQSLSHEPNSISVDLTVKDHPVEKANTGMDSEKDSITEHPSNPRACNVSDGQRVEKQICAPEAISVSDTNTLEPPGKGECKTPQQSSGGVGPVNDNLIQGTCSGEEGNCLIVQNPEKATESQEPLAGVTCSALEEGPSQTPVQEASSVSENNPMSQPISGSEKDCKLGQSTASQNIDVSSVGSVVETPVQNTASDVGENCLSLQAPDKNINSASEDPVNQPEIKSLLQEPICSSAGDIGTVQAPAHELTCISERDSVKKEVSDKEPSVVLTDHSTIKAPGPDSYCGDFSITDAPGNESSVLSGASSAKQTEAEGPKDQAQAEQCSDAPQSDTYKEAIGQIVKNLTSEVAEYETAETQKETASLPENIPTDLAQSATDQIGVQPERKLGSESRAGAADLSQEPLSQFEGAGFSSAPLTNEDSLDQITEKQVSEVLGLLSSLDEAAVDSGYIAACSAETSVTEHQNTGQEPQQEEVEGSTSNSDLMQNPAIVATELPEQIFQPETTVEMAIGRAIIDDQQESRMA